MDKAINAFLDEVITPIAAPSSTVKDVVEKLQSLGAFLGGSREKLKDFDYSSDRDWDFNAQSPKDWWSSDPLMNYILHNFKEMPTGEGYEGNTFLDDPQFVAYFKHLDYPHITVIVRKDLEAYKKMWKAIPKWYWEHYLWKSAPHIKTLIATFPEEEREERFKGFKLSISHNFRMLDEFMNNLKAPTKEDCM